jgi:cell division protein FtsZ
MNATPQNTIILGIGDGGCQTASSLVARWSEAPQAILINTDLSKWPHIAGVKIATHMTESIKSQMAFSKNIELGTGGNPRFGRRAAELYADQIKSMLENKKLAIIITALGGGTGTGAAPFIADMASNLNIRTIAFATLPFEFEGTRRMEQAMRGLTALEENADCVICLPNQRILDMVDDKTNPADAFCKANELLSDAIEIFWMTLASQTVINVDVDHIGVLMDKSAGKTIFVYSSAEGKDKIETVIKCIISHPVIAKENTLSNISAYLICALAGPSFSLKEIEKFTKQLSEKINIPDAMQMLGIGIKSEWDDRFMALLFAREKPVMINTALSDTADKMPPSSEGDSYIRKSKNIHKKKESVPDLFSYKGINQFKGVAPTIVGSVNLDVPTWIRRRIPIQKPSHY